MRHLARNLALAGPSIALLTLIATTGLSRAYPGDVFSVGSPAKSPVVPTPVEISSGTYGVSPQAGAAEYTFTVPVPPGRGDMAPTLALRYSSQNPLRGGLAAGFDFDVPRIEIDTTAGVLYKLEFQSSLAGGQRLVRVDEPLYGGSPPLDVTTYRAESDSDFVLYERHGDSPGYWIARHPNGTTYTFGFSPGARDGNVLSGRWMLDRVEDSHHNAIVYQWDEDHTLAYRHGEFFAADVRLLAIEYTSNDSANIGPHARVEFAYSAGTVCAPSTIPIGAEFTFRYGYPLFRGAARLQSIKVYSRPSPVSLDWQLRRQVDLGYDTAAAACNQPRAPLRLLTTVDQRVWAAGATTAETLPTITFGYGTSSTRIPVEAPAQQAPDLGGGLRHLDPREPGGWPAVTSMLLDVNGDSFVDSIKSRYQGEDSCETATSYSESGTFGTSTNATWPQRPWQDGDQDPNGQKDAENNWLRGAEGCNLAYQLDRRQNVLYSDPNSCPSTPANYTAFRLADITGDQIPELVMALDSKSGNYIAANDTAIYPSGTEPCADDCIDWKGDPGPCLPCRNSDNVEVRCSETASLVPQAEPFPPEPGEPGSCGCPPTGAGATCPFSQCVDETGCICDGASNPDLYCGECPLGTTSSLIDEFFQRSEQEGAGAGFWWQRFLPGEWGHESRPSGHYNPNCAYENETHCGRYVWRFREFNPAGPDWNGVPTLPDRIDAPVPLESYRPAEGALVTAFRGLVDMDGDHCADAVYWIPFNLDPQGYTAWKTALQVFRGDCRGNFSSTVTPGDPNPDPYRWPISSQVNRLDHGITRSLPSPAEEQLRLSEQRTSLIDVNGDGLVDFVEADGNQLVNVYYNTGRGFESSPTTLSTGTIGSVGQQQSVVLSRQPVTGQMLEGWSIDTIRSIDFDGDGLVDIAELAPPVYDLDHTDPWAQTDKSVRVHVNVGDALIPIDSTTDTERWWSGLARITMSDSTFWGVETDVVDLNGDGLFDLAGMTPQGGGCATGKAPLTCTPTGVGRDAGDVTGQSIRLLRSINNGRGAVIEFEYGSSGERTGADPIVVTNGGRLAQPVWLVRRMTVTPSSGAEPSVWDYRYVKPTFKEDHHGQWAFRGFGGVSTWEPLNESGARRRIYRRYSYLLDYSGRPFQTTVWDGDRLQTLEQTIWQRGELFNNTVESFHAVITRHYTCVSSGGLGGGMGNGSTSGSPEGEGGGSSDDTPGDSADDPYDPFGGGFGGGWGGLALAPEGGGQNQSLLGGALTEQDCIDFGVLKRTTRRFVSITPDSLSYSDINANLDLPSTGGVHIPENGDALMYVQRGERLTDSAGPDPTQECIPEDRGWVFGETLLYSADRYELLATDVRKVKATSNLWPGYELWGRTQTVFDNLAQPQASRVWRSETEYAETTRTFEAETGNVLTVHEPSGLLTTTTYDALELYPATVTPTISGANPPDLTVSYTHDIHTGQVTRQEGPAQPGKSTLPVVEIDYDGEGRPTRVRRSFDSGNQYVTDTVKAMTYFDHLADPLPHRVHVEELINRSAQTWIRRDTTLDGLGRPIDESVQFASGIATTSYGYDPAGNLASVTVPSPTGSGTAVSSYEYDALGRVTVAHQPGAPGEWQFSYDGKLATRELHVEDESALLLDEMGQLTVAQRTILDSDAFDRLRTVTESGSPGADATWSYDYDPNDNMKGIVDADQIATAMTHDFVGHRKTVTRTDTGDIDRTWQYDYDLAGNLVAEIMPFDGGEFTIADFTSTWSYDELGRVTSHRTASRGMTDISRYFPASATPGEIFTSYEYDQTGHGSGVGRLTHVELPFGSIDYDYSVEGWATQEDRQFTITPEGPSGPSLGDTRTYQVSYNALGQPIRVTHADNATTPTVTRAVYDERGLPQYVNRLVKDANGVEQPTLLARVARNTAGLPTTRYSNFDQGQSWTYDPLGRVSAHAIRSCTAALATPSVSQICAGSGTTVGGETIAYHDSGDVDTMQDPFSGATIDYTFDAQHQLRHAETVAGSLYQADMTYSPAGRVQAAQVTSSAPGAMGRNVSHEYSPADPANDPAADPHAVRRLIDQTSQNTLGVLDYDPTGNLIHKTWSAPGQPGDAQDHEFIYDGDNLLREVGNHQQGGDVSEVYFYDHAGQRMLAYTGADGSTPARLRLWFGQTEIEYDVSTTPIQPVKTDVFANLGAMSVARIHRDAGDQPLDAELDLLYSGVLGSLLAVVGTPTTPDPANHGLLARYFFGPFGELLARAGTEQDDFHRLFNGKEHDELTSLSYYGFRFYDRLTLTWTQADPLYRFEPDLAWDEPRRGNLYTFSMNNPLRYLDPDGRNPEGQPIAPRRVTEEEKEQIEREIKRGNIRKAARLSIIYQGLDPTLITAIIDETNTTTETDPSAEYEKNTIYVKKGALGHRGLSVDFFNSTIAHEVQHAVRERARGSDWQALDPEQQRNEHLAIYDQQADPRLYDFSDSDLKGLASRRGEYEHDKKIRSHPSENVRKYFEKDDAANPINPTTERYFYLKNLAEFRLRFFEYRQSQQGRRKQ